MEINRRDFLVSNVAYVCGYELTGFLIDLGRSTVSKPTWCLPKLDTTQQQKVEHMIAERQKEMAEEDNRAQRRMLFCRIRKGKFQLSKRNYAAAIHVLSWGGCC